MIELREVSKTYRGVSSGADVQALRDVSLSIAKGEFVALMGASGSGKSTLMSILGALDRPTSGHYGIGGDDVSAMSDEQLSQLRNHRIGFVFQAFNLLPLFTAQENVELPLAYAPDVDAEDARTRAHSALEAVGLADRSHHRPGELSGGQQQRVAIARALVTQAPIILADEPTGNLDSRAATEVMAIFTRLWKAGQTLVLVTHSPEIAGYARRILTVKDGRIASDEVNPTPRDAAAELAALPAEVVS